MKHDIHTSSPGRLIPLGEIVGTHGVRGLLRFHPYDPAASPPPVGRRLYVRSAALAASDREASRAPTVVLEDARPHGNVMLLRIAGIASIAAAATLVGLVLAIPEADLPATTPGELYVYQLEGLEVFVDAGERLGTIASSFSNGAHEVLVVRAGPREILIPMIADVVRAIDLPGRRVVIEPIPGLLDS
ncbi:MAG: 16S rRNA processing protein RimM [Polyangiaceae bacterium UTPRO1]|jgi:16S rRNA processing protein RimM|nr:ribosome maturation factor RimM [Myxococcales bacterium]OQY64848.1 MAG: 16S rRNA processing protein RimM [Polyangiaceae bacterium UTPRO1]